MIAVQALNAFNDNFVKILLVAFAGVVAKGTDLGGSMQVYLGAIFSLPYVLFAPLTGWLSDRCSKQRVMLWMQVAQVLIFLLFLATHGLHDPQMTLWLSLGCFFLLATQAAFFSPAKYGIVKELVGSRRMGSATGTLQLTNFVGILAGMGLAGFVFGEMIKGAADPAGAAWDAVTVLLWVVTGISLLQIVGSLMIMRTPGHDALRFHAGIMTEHFAHLKLVFSDRPIKLAALGVTYFWFMSNAVGSILVTLANELHPADPSAVAVELSMMPGMLGVGIMLGSVLAGYVCRRRIELGLVPLSGYLLAATLFWSGIHPVRPSIYFALVGVGLAAGAFMTPLYAFVQDRCKPEERGRILSAMNLMDCVGGIVANIVLVKGMLILKVPAWVQLLVMVPITLAAAVFITRLLPRNLLLIVVNAIVRTFYRIRVHHEERMPKDGPLLVLPNHVSYADAVTLGVSTERMVRFVMLDSLYRIRWMQWFLRLFGTVPISATKAKEAVRTVADALKEGKAVVLFAEGQLTRTGFLNEMRKGYELMARMGGEGVRVQPVWQDGLWGSIFSYEGGRFFKKVPKALPYRVSIWYGEPMEAKEATAERVREALLELSAEAFLARRRVQQVPRLVLPDGRVLSESEAAMAWANASRILETSLLREGDAVLCLLPQGHPLTGTFHAGLATLRRIPILREATQAAEHRSKGHRVIAIGGRADFAAQAHEAWDFALVGVEVADAQGGGVKPSQASGPWPVLFDGGTSALLTLQVPDPKLPEKEQGAQRGVAPGSLGHLLPGLAVRGEAGGLIFRRTSAAETGEVRVEGVTLDAQGFVLAVKQAEDARSEAPSP